MIWDPRNRPDPDGRFPSGGSDDIARIVRELFAEAGMAPEAESSRIEALCAAIEAFLASGDSPFSPSPAQTSSLVTRALSSMGEMDMARRVLVFGTGMAATSAWRTSGDDPVWTLDLQRLCSADGPLLEMTLFACLRLALESLSGIWEDTRGRGVLGLRHVSRAATGVLGREARSASIRGQCEDIQRQCRAFLSDIARRRGWIDVPVVLNLDLF